MPRTSLYSARIAATLAKYGMADVNPAHVEAFMRLYFGTLDHLGGALWDREVREAAAAARQGTTEANDVLAESYGLVRL